jgi:hypothetical protein
MATVTNDGGPAFPPAANNPFGLVMDGEHHGMSLRDYFAAKVLAGMHARDTYDDGQATPAQRAALAYLDADAMLAERAKR